MHMLKYFCIWFWFHGDIHICKKLCSVIDTAELDSAVALTPQGASLAVSLRPGSQTPRYHWHRGVKLSSVIDTAEFFAYVNISLKSKPYAKILQHMHKRPRRVWIMKKLEKISWHWPFIGCSFHNLLILIFFHYLICSCFLHNPLILICLHFNNLRLE